MDLIVNFVSGLDCALDSGLDDALDGALDDVA